MNHPFRLKNAALLMALASIYPLHGHAATGIAQFAVGDVNVRRGATTLPVSRGQQINAGDSIVTGRAGQAQIRFSDGGLVALAPDSQFNIDKYVDENKPDQDGFFASFLRGGMRAITGLVGKRNRDSYKITTTTATIGIRGSAFSANYNSDGSVNIACEQDGIVVCTRPGCVDLIVGEAVRVTSNDELPSRTAARSNVAPMAAREDLFNLGSIEVLQLLQFVLPTEIPIDPTVSGVSAMFAFNGAFIDTQPRGGVHPSDGEATIVNGELLRHVGTAGSRVEEIEVFEHPRLTVEKTSSESSTVGLYGSAQDDALAGWGYWNAGRISGGSIDTLSPEESGNDFDNGVHYVVGRPTPQASMPMSGTATYALLGGSVPTAFDGETLRFGTLVSAGLNVDFGMSRINAFITTRFSAGATDRSVQIGGYGNLQGTTFSVEDEDVALYGFFIGSQAVRAGLVYRGYDAAIGTVNGAAVFSRSGTGDAYTEQAGMAAMVAAVDGPFDSFPRGDLNPTIGIGHFVGNQLYLHDDGEDSQNGYGYGGYDGSSFLATSGPVSHFGSIGDPGDSAFIGWGYWANGEVRNNNNGNSPVSGVHYIVGRPTASNDMPSSGTASYSMVGGTAPTATDSNGATIMGRLLGATMDVDFANRSASAIISTDFVKSGVVMPVSIQHDSLSISGARISGPQLCGTNISGFFTGSQAAKAGLIYRSDTFSDLGVVRGAVGLQRGAIMPDQ